MPAPPTPRGVITPRVSRGHQQRGSLPPCYPGPASAGLIEPRGDHAGVGPGPPDPYYPRVWGCRFIPAPHAGLRGDAGSPALPPTARGPREARDGSSPRLPVERGGVTPYLSSRTRDREDSVRSPPAAPGGLSHGLPRGLRHPRGAEAPPHGGPRALAGGPLTRFIGPWARGRTPWGPL